MGKGRVRDGRARHENQKADHNDLYQFVFNSGQRFNNGIITVETAAITLAIAAILV